LCLLQPKIRPVRIVPMLALLRVISTPAPKMDFIVGVTELFKQAP